MLVTLWWGVREIDKISVVRLAGHRCCRLRAWLQPCCTLLLQKGTELVCPEQAFLQPRTIVYFGGGERNRTSDLRVMSPSL